MKKIRSVATLALIGCYLLVLLASPANGGGTCPHPLPSCTTPGNLSNLSGTFSCSRESFQQNDKQVNVSVLYFTADGSGNFSGKVAENSTLAKGNTFTDFSSITGTYCLNTDNTGYFFPSSDCPGALILTNNKTHTVAIESKENTASIINCTK